jgi:hypothetical protein
MMRNSIFCFCILFFNVLNGQTPSFSSKVIASAGQYREVGTIGINYTIGEPLIRMATTSSNIFTFGFNQNENITNATVEIEGKTIDVKLSPNPVKDILTITLSGKIDMPLTWQLSDIMGRQLHAQRTLAGQSQCIIPMDNMPTGTYLIQFIDQKGNFLQAFKIVKSQ